MLVGGVRRLPLGTFTRPPEETGGRARVEGVYGYLVRHERGLVLLDTGMGRGDDETEEWYEPRRSPCRTPSPPSASASTTSALVANCHLHFDHCGGNPLLGGIPVLCQREELADRAGRWLHLRPPARGPVYELLDGEAGRSPGVHVIPTPGPRRRPPVPVVECRGRDRRARRAVARQRLGAERRRAGAAAAPPCMERLLAFDPRAWCSPTTPLCGRRAESSAHQP